MTKSLKVNLFFVTMPIKEYLYLFNLKDKKAIENICANQYDLVLIGNEINCGSFRIYNSVKKQKVFNIIGWLKEEFKENFGFMLEVFKYGVPQHGDIAFGYDRIIVIPRGLKSITNKCHCFTENCKYLSY